MPSGYTLEPHTADIRIRLWAETLPELFAVALEALADILRPGGCRAAETLPVQQPVSVTAPDQTALLVDFLSEALLYSQIRKALFCRVHFHQLTEQEVRGVLQGRRVRGFVQDVKAVTYHEAEIRPCRGGYEAQLVVDV